MAATGEAELAREQGRMCEEDGGGKRKREESRRRWRSDRQGLDSGGDPDEILPDAEEEEEEEEGGFNVRGRQSTGREMVARHAICRRQGLPFAR